MKKLLCFILLLAAFATLPAQSEIEGDFDGDGIVGLSDLNIFSVGWLTDDPDADLDDNGIVNISDFSIFSNQWRIGYENNPPTADDIAISCRHQRTVLIELSGSDDLGAPLTFAITQMPQKGTLAKQDNNHYLYYASDAGGVDTILYKANDGQNDSQAAEITITIIPLTLDSIYVSSGDIIIYDGNSIQMDTDWAITFWMQTRFDTGLIASKIEDGVGFILLLRGGKPQLNLYDRSGAVYVLGSTMPIAGSGWVMMVIMHRASGGIVTNPQSAEEENLTTAFGLFDGSLSDFSFAALPALDIQCEAPLQFGKGTSHCTNYQGWYLYEQIDAVNVYNGGLTILDSTLVFAEQRTQTPHALSIAADTRFYINEGSGNIIYSHDSQHSGQINPLYEWAPEDHLIQHEGDIRLRMRGFPGAPMHGK